MKGTKEKVNHKNLAPLLVCEKELEESPLTFRGQPNVNLIIDLDEYIRFILDTPEAESYLFSCDNFNTYGVVQDYKNMGDAKYKRNITRAMYLDIAAAIFKEIWYCENMLITSGTPITPNIIGAEVLPLSSIFGMYNSYSIDYNDMLNSFLTKHGYSAIINCSGRNLHLQVLANVLVWLSFESDDVYSFIINT